MTSQVSRTRSPDEKESARHTGQAGRQVTSPARLSNSGIHGSKQGQKRSLTVGSDSEGLLRDCLNYLFCCHKMVRAELTILREPALSATFHLCSRKSAPETLRSSLSTPCIFINGTTAGWPILLCSERLRLDTPEGFRAAQTTDRMIMSMSFYALCHSHNVAQDFSVELAAANEICGTISMPSDYDQFSLLNKRRDSCR